MDGRREGVTLRRSALVARHLHNFLFICINFCSPAQLVQPSAPELVEGAASRRRYKAA